MARTKQVEAILAVQNVLLNMAVTELDNRNIGIVRCDPELVGDDMDDVRSHEQTMDDFVAYRSLPLGERADIVRKQGLALLRDEWTNEDGVS